MIDDYLKYNITILKIFAINGHRRYCQHIICFCCLMLFLGLSWFI